MTESEWEQVLASIRARKLQTMRQEYRRNREHHRGKDWRVPGNEWMTWPDARINIGPNSLNGKWN